MANFLQIINILADGSEAIYHPETDADYVVDSKTKKVPTIININDWISKSEELVNARKGEANLGDKIALIDSKLTASSLLTSIKTVDGSSSGLDSDRVDGRDVNDADISENSIWTSKKVYDELGKRVGLTEVVSVATPNKILKLNSTGELVANVNGNASSANALMLGSKAININNVKTIDCLWTADRVVEEIKYFGDKILEKTTIANNEMTIGGIASMRFGDVNIKGLTSIQVTYSSSFTTSTLVSDFSIVSVDSDLRVINKVNTANGITFTLNKAATEGKLSYIAIGL